MKNEESSRGSYTVGQIATRCGVAVKTVQYYAEEGLLTPSGGVTDAGYRLFTSADVEDLRFIRSLRALGFTLGAIRKLMQDEADPRDMARMQLEVIDAQLRGLTRQRTIVNSALSKHDDSDVRRRLELAAVAASLGAAERASVVERFLERSRRGVPLEPDSRLRQMLTIDLPDELSDEQLESWLALSTLLEDGDFVATLHAQHEPFNGASQAESAGFGALLMPILADAVRALEDGCKTDSERVRALVGRWTQAFADGLHRTNDAEFRRWLIGYTERTNDPRIQHFWELVAALKGRPGAISPFTAATQLLMDGLRVMQPQ